MEKILISACLLGEKVRYHGGDAKVDDKLLARWSQERRLVSFCPEVGAGMSAPRPPSEITNHGGGPAVWGGTARIKNQDGTDVTDIYLRGAQMALALALEHHIRIAILKDGSPSCGSLRIYDGTFSGVKLEGSGVTASLLGANGIRVFSEGEIAAAGDFLSSLEN